MKAIVFPDETIRYDQLMQIMHNIRHMASQRGKVVNCVLCVVDPSLPYMSRREIELLISGLSSTFICIVTCYNHSASAEDILDEVLSRFDVQVSIGFDSVHSVHRQWEKEDAAELIADIPKLIISHIFPG